MLIATVITIGLNIGYIDRLHRGQWLRRPPAHNYYAGCLVNPHNSQELLPELFLALYTHKRGLVLAPDSPTPSRFLNGVPTTHEHYNADIGRPKFIRILESSPYHVIDKRHFFIFDGWAECRRIRHYRSADLHMYVPDVGTIQ